MGLRPFRQNVSYFAIDADQLPVSRPDLCARIMQEVTGLLAQGALSPLPRRSFEADEVVDAFRLMQGSGHIGKLVIRPPAPAAAADAAPEFPVRADATYLIVGGLGGLGLETARWLIDRGARHLALATRRGPEAPGAQEALAGFRDRGVEVEAFACDVADGQSLAAVLEAIRARMAPLRGVFHAAMVIDDGLAFDLTLERLEAVLAPKLTGALNLDRLTRTDPLELFVLYSSATTFLGAPGQGAYVAANAGLEALARVRRAEGLPALAVAFGPIADVGFLARDAASRDALARRLAAMPIPAREALDAIPELWARGEAAPAYARVQWDNARRALAILRTPTFAAFAGAGSEQTGQDLRERLTELEPQEATQLIAGVLAEEMGRILMAGGDAVDPNRPLTEYGVDSLMAVEFRLAVESRLGLELPLLAVGDGLSLGAIAEKIVRSTWGSEARASVIETVVRHELAGPLPAPTQSQEDGRFAPAAE